MSAVAAVVQMQPAQQPRWGLIERLVEPWCDRPWRSSPVREGLPQSRIGGTSCTASCQVSGRLRGLLAKWHAQGERHEKGEILLQRIQITAHLPPVGAKSNKPASSADLGRTVINQN